MRSRRSGSFAYKLATCCPSLRHVGIASPDDGCESLSRRDLMHIGRLRHLSALELVDCVVPAGLQPLCSGAASAAAAAAALAATPAAGLRASAPSSHLHRLTLRCCGLHGAALAALSPLAPTLQMLVLEGVALSQADVGGRDAPGAGLQAIAALTDLRSLTLSSCDGVDRSGLEALTALQDLQYLDMADVWELGGDTLHPLASLTSLKVCSLLDAHHRSRAAPRDGRCPSAVCTHAFTLWLDSVRPAAACVPVCS